MQNISIIFVWLLTRGRPMVMGLLIVSTLFFSVFAARLPVEQDTRSMTSRNPEQVALYDKFRQLFGNDEDLLLSVTHPQLLEPNQLSLLAELTRQISEFEGVVRVFSLSNARQLVAGPYGAEARPLLPEGEPGEDSGNRIEAVLQANPHYQGLLISPDRKTAGLIIELEDRSDDADLRRSLISRVRNLIGLYSDRARMHLTGVGVQQSDVASFIQRDQQVILPLVALVLVVMLAGIFRRPSGVILPMLTTGISLIWTMGLYSLSGFELNTITALLSPVVMVLAVSNSVHLYNGWLNLQGQPHQRIELLAGKVNELFIPCFFTALTTALGLLSLTISSVPAVRQFGLFAAVGVMLSFLVALTVLPVGLSFLPLPGRRHRTGTGLLRWILHRTARLTIRHASKIMGIAVILLVVALFGLPRLQNNTNLIGFLHADAPLAVDTRYIDRHLAGVNVLDFMIVRSDGLPLDRVEDYRRIEQFAKLTTGEAAVAGHFSILTLLKPLHRAESGATELALPDNNDDLRYELELMANDAEQSLRQRFIAADRKTARVSIRLHDIGSREAAGLIENFQQQGQQIFGADYRLQPTGSYYRMIDDSNRLVADMIKSFSLSLLLVTLSILLLLRSPWLTLLSMIPNVIPILWTVGVMGYCKIDLSTGTAMIGAVVIGLAVDDTIHYLVNYRRVFTGSVRRAVTITTTRVGRALMIASLVLALGFWVGCFGSFKPTIYFSLLVGGTLIGALICDLLVLPACLVLGDTGRKVRPA